MVEAKQGNSQVSKTPLEEVMVAMDVVDTLRHDQSIAERELDGEGRRERLLERLREMYSAQGIDVPDHVLYEGIDALEQERFKYEAVAPSWQTKLAHAWVSRGRWGKPLSFLAVIASVFYGVYFLTDVMPERSMRAELPQKVTRSLNAIISIAKNPDIVSQAQASAANAEQALVNDDFSKANAIVENMQNVYIQLQQEYSIRVISQPGENSGVFRNPPNNPDGRNYYLIVEAIDKSNNVVELTILNQENNKAARKKSWGLRVNEETFYKVAADKRDDGIIQGNKVGEKAAGYLKPVFSIPTTGATITEW